MIKMKKPIQVVLMAIVLITAILGKLIPIEAQTENAWVLVEVVDYPEVEGWKQANKHESYNNDVTYNPSSFSVKTTYIGRSEGQKVKGEGIRLSATFSIPPQIIYKDEEVSLSLNMQATENTLSFFGFSSSAKADFYRDVNIKPNMGAGTRFIDADKKHYWSLDTHSNYKTIEKTIKAKAPTGYKTGDQMVLRQIYFQGVPLATYYVYEWKALGENKPVTPSRPATQPKPVQQGSGFSDLPTSHWAHRSIMEMVDLGILAGYTDGTFKPNNTISRAEFSKILVLSLKLPEVRPASPAFSDVPANHWAYSVVESAKPYLTGYRTSSGDMSFQPSQVAVREDVAVAIVKAKGLANSSAKLDLLNQYSDQGQISNALRNHVAIAVEQGYMTGTNIGFEPQKALTRAEACALLSRLIDRSQFESKEKVPYS